MAYQKAFIPDEDSRDSAEFEEGNSSDDDRAPILETYDDFLQMNHGPEPKPGVPIFKKERMYNVFEFESLSYFSYLQPLCTFHFPTTSFANISTVLFEHSCDDYQKVINFSFKQFSVSEKRSQENQLKTIIKQITSRNDAAKYFPEIKTMMEIFINLGFYGIDFDFNDEVMQMQKDIKRKASKTTQKSISNIDMPTKMESILNLIEIIAAACYEHKEILEGAHFFTLIFYLSLDETILEHKRLKIDFSTCLEAIINSLPETNYEMEFIEILKNCYEYIKVSHKNVHYILELLANSERSLRLKRALAFAYLEKCLQVEESFKLDPDGEDLAKLMDDPPCPKIKDEMLELFVAIMDAMFVYPYIITTEYAVRFQIHTAVLRLTDKCNSQRCMFGLRILHKKLTRNSAETN